MTHQEDWQPILPSVLFAIQISQHSSTGLFPYRMLCQQDPVLPFQFMDKMNNGGLDRTTISLNSASNNNSDDSENNGPICEIVDQLEQMWQASFAQASQNIKKAQKHQAKCHNSRHSGSPFKVGDKVLKRNMKDALRIAKLKNNYTGPYIITDISISGLYFIHNNYSHQLNRPIPPNQLVCYYGVDGFYKQKVQTHADISNVNLSDADIPSPSAQIHPTSDQGPTYNQKAKCSGEMSIHDSSDLIHFHLTLILNPNARKIIVTPHVKECTNTKSVNFQTNRNSFLALNGNT